MQYIKKQRIKSLWKLFINPNNRTKLRKYIKESYFKTILISSSQMQVKLCPNKILFYLFVINSIRCRGINIIIIESQFKNLFWFTPIVSNSSLNQTFASKFIEFINLRSRFLHLKIEPIFAFLNITKFCYQI